MFEKFGEFDSAGEMNMCAEGLREEGDIKALLDLQRRMELIRRMQRITQMDVLENL